MPLFMRCEEFRTDAFTLLAALHAGCPGAFVALAGTDPLGVRDLMFDPKLFLSIV